MRGGSIPLLVWGTLIGVLLALNLVWTGDDIQAGAFAFALVTIWGAAASFAVRSRRESLKRGAPPPQPGTETIATASLGAVLVAVALASLVYGFAFGRFLVYFGTGLLILSLGLVIRERREERRTRQLAAERERS